MAQSCRSQRVKLVAISVCSTPVSGRSDRRFLGDIWSGVQFQALNPVPTFILENVLENMFENVFPTFSTSSFPGVVLTFSPEYVHIFVQTFSGKLVPYVFSVSVPDSILPVTSCNRPDYFHVIVPSPSMESFRARHQILNGRSTPDSGH